MEQWVACRRQVDYTSPDQTFTGLGFFFVLQMYYMPKPCKHATEALPVCKKCCATRSNKLKYYKKIAHTVNKNKREDNVTTSGRERLRRAAGIIDAHRFDEVLLNQDSRCAICLTDQWDKKGPCADHDHATGLLRGVLCNNCNNGIGRLKDSPSLLAAAFAYLIDPPAQRKDRS